MKFYLHFESVPEFTMVVKWEDDQEGKVQDMIRLFCGSYNKRHGDVRLLLQEDVFLATRDRKKLKFSDSIHILKDKSDVFVHVNDENEEQLLEKKATEKTPIVKPKEKPTSVAAPKTNQEVNNKKKKKKGGIHRGIETFVSSYNSDEEEYLKCDKEEPEFKIEIIYKPELKAFCIETKQIEPDCGCEPMKKATRFLAESNCRKAKEIFEIILQDNKKHREALLGMYRVYTRGDRPEKALIYIREAKKYYPTDYKISKLLAICLLKLKEAKEALGLFDTCIRQKGSLKKVTFLNIQVYMVKCYFVLGENLEAQQLLKAVVKTSCEHHKALLEYALMIHRKSQADHKEAVTMVLKVLAQTRGKDKGAVINLVKILQPPNGIKHLQSELQETWDSVAAQTFLANLLRDNGAIAESAVVMERAVKLKGDSPKPLLNLMHLYEIQSKHQEAFDLALNFLKNNREISIAGVDCFRFIPLMECVESNIYLNDTSPGMAGIVITIQHPKDRPYTNDELYYLAILFTVVKVLFMKGSLSVLRGMTRLLDPCYKDRDLHKTLIRNEAAYYVTISRLMTIDINPVPASPKFIYFASDSHCLTPAWRSIQYKGSTHFIHPMLATGCKIWHLRPEGMFYPKENFFTIMKRVPKKSTVIFNLGEIDCREGIIYAVDKCKYDSLEEGINKVIEIYLTVVKKLKSLKRLKVFIHPVNPVMDITRQIVIKFNAMLKEAVEQTDGMTWLDFVDDLLVGSDRCLDPQYYLDETHLHPHYLPLLETALNRKTS